jgi:hypothetical protein
MPGKTLYQHKRLCSKTHAFHTELKHRISIIETKQIQEAWGTAKEWKALSAGVQSVSSVAEETLSYETCLFEVRT